MAALYDFKENPTLPNDKEKPLLHPRIVSSGTIDTHTLLKEISEDSTFTPGELKGVLIAFTEKIGKYLSNGYHVQLGDIGYFSAKLKAVKSVADKDKVRSASVVFDNVNFRASAQLRKLLHGDLVRAPYTAPTSEQYTVEERKALLSSYLEQAPLITRSEYTKLTGVLKRKALIELKEFADEGILKIHGGGNQMIFVRPDSSNKG